MDDYNLTIKEKLYFNTFFNFARRGFYSFDRTMLFDDDEKYHLVARPIISPKRHNKKFSIDGIPYIETSSIKLQGKMSKCIGIKLIEIINNR